MCSGFGPQQETHVIFQSDPVGSSFNRAQAGPQPKPHAPSNRADTEMSFMDFTISDVSSSCEDEGPVVESGGFWITPSKDKLNQ
ncbi:hypothetical protein Tco_1200946 [Tanacetum coccineum]